jgi:hypothetical protein
LGHCVNETLTEKFSCRLTGLDPSARRQSSTRLQKPLSRLFIRFSDIKFSNGALTETIIDEANTCGSTITLFDIDDLPRNDKHGFFQRIQNFLSITNEKRLNPTGLLKV